MCIRDRLGCCLVEVREADIYGAGTPHPEINKWSCLPRVGVWQPQTLRLLLMYCRYTQPSCLLMLVIYCHVYRSALHFKDANSTSIQQGLAPIWSLSKNRRDFQDEKMSVDFQYFRSVRHRAIHHTLQRCFKTTKYMCSSHHNHNHHHYHRQCIQLSLSASSTRHTLSQTSIAGAMLFSSPVTAESLVLLASCCFSSVMDRQNISAHSTTDQTLWSRIWDWPSPSALPTNQC